MDEQKLRKILMTICKNINVLKDAVEYHNHDKDGNTTSGNLIKEEHGDEFRSYVTDNIQELLPTKKELEALAKMKEAMEKKNDR